MPFCTIKGRNPSSHHSRIHVQCAQIQLCSAPPGRSRPHLPMRSQPTPPSQVWRQPTLPTLQVSVVVAARACSIVAPHPCRRAWPANTPTLRASTRSDAGPTHPRAAPDLFPHKNLMPDRRCIQISKYAPNTMHASARRQRTTREPAESIVCFRSTRLFQWNAISRVNDHTHPAHAHSSNAKTPEPPELISSGSSVRKEKSIWSVPAAPQLSGGGGAEPGLRSPAPAPHRALAPSRSTHCPARSTGRARATARCHRTTGTESSIQRSAASSA